MSQSNTPADHVTEPVDTSHLFDEFQPLSREAWEQKIRKDLKVTGDAEYEKKTFWRTSEGFTLQPFYDAGDLAAVHSGDSEPGQFPYVRGRRGDTNAWEIREEIYDVEPSAANRRALTALEAGVDAVCFVLTAERGQLRGVHLSGDVETSFQKLLDGIWLDAAPIHFRAGVAAPLVLALLRQEIQRQKLDPAKITGTLDYDPLSDLAREGEVDSASSLAIAAGLVRFTQKNLPGVRPLAISDRVFHNAGAGIVEELALVLAAGNEMLATLTDASAGLELDAICQSLSFDFSISSNYFMEIARLRSARLLWSRIVQEYVGTNDRTVAGDPAKRAMFIHGRTSQWNQTVYDPYVNMLRATTETMSAALGACDAFTVLPFDLPLRPDGSDDFGARMARNTQQVIKHEAYLDKVIDPAAGSYYLENLTDQIARDAWALFQEIEAAGGYLKSLESGLIQSRVVASADRARAAVASRRQTVLGTNQYPNGQEQARDKIATAVPRPLPTGSGAVKLPAISTESDDWLTGLPALATTHGVGPVIADLRGTPDRKITPLRIFRVADEFESLRLSTEKFAAGGGQIPRVFLVTYGDLAMRKARGMFAANFFACAGYEIINNPGFETALEGAQAAIASGAEIAVFCSSDAEYGEQAAAAAAQLQVAKKVRIVIAGNPVDHLENLSAAGVQHFIHAKSNALDELQEFQKELGL